MNSLTLLHNFLTNTTNILNFVLSVELAIACGMAVISGWLTDEATAGKIALLAAIAAIMFRLWQSWPHELVLLTVLPQCAFWVFAGAWSAVRSSGVSSERFCVAEKLGELVK